MLSPKQIVCVVIMAAICVAIAVIVPKPVEPDPVAPVAEPAAPPAPDDQPELLGPPGPKPPGPKPEELQIATAPVLEEASAAQYDIAEDYLTGSYDKEFQKKVREFLRDEYLTKDEYKIIRDLREVNLMAEERAKIKVALQAERD